MLSTEAAKRGRPWTGREGTARRGFTLLEVMVAVTIFGIVSIAIYSTFRAGLLSYEKGREQMAVTQTSRGVFDLLSRDLRGIYYRPPKTYNRSLIAQLQIRAAQNLSLENIPPAMRDRGRLRQAMRRLAGDRREGEELDEEPPGIPINLTILGADEEAGDALTFVTYQVHWGTAAVEPWALARVKYFVEGDNLFRAEGPVWVESVPSFQWEPPPLEGEEEEYEEEPTSDADEIADYLKDAPRELIARYVRNFDIRYGYWTEEGWFETSEWVAHEHQHRNPPWELDSLAAPSDLQAARQRMKTRPTDDIPAYVVITLELGFGPDSDRTQLFRTKMRLLTSQETYMPAIDPSVSLGGGASGGPTRPDTSYGR